MQILYPSLNINNFQLDNTAVVDHIIDKIIKMNRHEDGSIRPDDGSFGLEYTTPVLSAFDELECVLLVLDVLKAAGARTNASCGLHFHLGIINFSTIPPQVEKEHYQLELTKSFLILYYRFAEPNFRKVLRPYNRYCKNQGNLKSSAQGDCGFYATIRQCRTLNELINLAWLALYRAFMPLIFAPCRNTVPLKLDAMMAVSIEKL